MCQRTPVLRYYMVLCTEVEILDHTHTAFQNPVPDHRTLLSTLGRNVVRAIDCSI